MKTITTAGVKAPLILKTKALRDKATAATLLTASTSGKLPNDLLPNLKIEIRSISSLKPGKNRTRKTTPKQLELILQSIKRSGFIGGILVKDDRIVDGHTRFEAVKALGLQQIPCIEVGHLSEEQTRFLALTMNRTGETGEWCTDGLRIEILELEAYNFDLSNIGFSLPELDLIKLDPTPHEAAGLLDSIPDFSLTTVTRLDDCWQLGEHRLICGDARDFETYKRLLKSELAACVFSDPPYNCKIAGNVSGLGKVKHGEFAMASGELSDPEFGKFLSDYLTCAMNACAERSVIFSFMNWREYPLLTTSAATVGLKQIAAVVWDKGSGGMGSPYRSTYELIAVFCTGKNPAINNIELGKHGRDRANVWHFAGANKPGSSAAKALHDHPTPKPVELVVNAILDFTKPGDIVLDPFMGSGTTIVACMESQRIARGIELDPKYVDVALRRWSALTGDQPVLSATGETFDAVAKRRSAEAAIAEPDHI